MDLISLIAGFVAGAIFGVLGGLYYIKWKMNQQLGQMQQEMSEMMEATQGLQEGLGGLEGGEGESPESMEDVIEPGEIEEEGSKDKKSGQKEKD